MYLLNIIQQIIQSQCFKTILTILGVISKNTKEWIRMNLCTNQANYTTNSQTHATTDARIVNDKLSKQGMMTADNQYHHTHIKNQFYQIQLQKVISTAIIVIPHVLTGRLRRHLRHIRRR